MTEAKEPKWLYRLESTDPENGIWYDSNGDEELDIREVFVEEQ